MDNDLFYQFEHGMLAGAGQVLDFGAAGWNRHADFAGVSIKNLVSAEQGKGLFTCHLVRIDPHHSIGLHTHPGSIELHEVIKGSGVCCMEQGEFAYVPGVMAVIGRNEAHEVRAGQEGLFLFAKFITAA